MCLKQRMFFLSYVNFYVDLNFGCTHHFICDTVYFKQLHLA